MADLRKAELFPADAFGLFYLHQPALRGVRRQSTSLLYSSTGWPSDKLINLLLQVLAQMMNITGQ